MPACEPRRWFTLTCNHRLQRRIGGEFFGMGTQLQVPGDPPHSLDYDARRSLLQMNIPLPSTIVASLPTQYVRYLDNTNIAYMDSPPAIPDHSIDVVVSDAELRWQYGDSRLNVKLDSLYFASLSVGSHGPERFVFLTLHFGDPAGGGVRMLNAPLADAHAYDEIYGLLSNLLPCDFHDRRDTESE